MSEILSNRWVQLILVMIFFSFAKGAMSAILHIEHYPPIGFLKCFERREWGWAAFIMLYDFGYAAYGVMFLRAAGIIEFVK